MTTRDFSTVTELPGVGATREQLSMLYTRYHLAAAYSKGKEVLEVACGAGLGLGYLARHAERVVGGDIDMQNIRIARESCKDEERVKLYMFDAQCLPFADDGFDAVILYEAIYYLPEPKKFLKEARRVLRPGGNLLVCTANREWGGFNPSPSSARYFSARELDKTLWEEGFRPRIFGGFPEDTNSLKRRIISAIRKSAVRLKLIPKTMKGKEWLKRLFYGRLTPLGAQVQEGMAPLAPLTELAGGRSECAFKVLYGVASVEK